MGTGMDGMFYGASAFNQDIGSWNTSKVIYTDNMGIYMDNMFEGATSFNYRYRPSFSGPCIENCTYQGSYGLASLTCHKTGVCSSSESDEASISTIIIIIVFVIGLGMGIWACVRCCQRNGGCCQPKSVYYSGELRSHIQQPIPASVELAQQTQEADSTKDGDLVPDKYKTPSNYYR